MLKQNIQKLDNQDFQKIISLNFVWVFFSKMIKF